MADLYGIRCWNADGQLILDVSDKITQIIWSGVVKFPNDVPTGPNWPNQSNNNFAHAARSFIIESEGFKNGTPFLVYHDHNGKYSSGGTHQIAGISQGMLWSMISETKMSIRYVIFSPGWSRSQILSEYNNMDIPLMVGIY
jgi:hypothetical protein